MKFLLFLLLQHAVYLGTNMQYLKGSTYYTSCMSSDDCFGSEECLDDPICNQSKCQCDSAHFYNKISNTCEGKKKYEAEECDNCDQCSTWFSVCETVASRGKSVCTCPRGYFYESDTDSCTNIERCPEDSSYIFFRDENVCYKVETDCVGCHGWDHFCKENSSVPLKFVGNLQQHLIDRLWSYGISAYQDLSDEVKTIILSTVHNNTADGEKLVWYWPSGGVVPIDDGIDYTDWTNAIEADGCLYMLSDACQPVFRAERPCRLQNAYRGCFIQLPAAYCNTHIDERGTVWEFTKGGTVVTKSCPAGYTGEVTRGCATNGEFKLPFYNCTLEIFKNLTEKLENGNVSAPEALADVSSSIKDLDDLFIGDLLEVQNILHKIVNLVDETVNSTISENSTNDFIETASFLIDSEKNGREWESRVENEGKGAEEFLNVVETFVKLAADSLLGSNKSSLSLAKKNIVFEYAEIDTKNTAPEAISFPTANRHSPDWNNTLTSSLQLDTSSFKNEGVKAFTSLLYRNLSKSVPQTLEGKSRDVKVDINSQVISFVLLPKSPDILNPELGLQFHGFKDMGSSEQHCSFWKTDLSRGKSFWSTKGCRKVAGNSTVVTCKCNHLTNFALLVSTYVPPEKDVRILGILTYIGCSVSMFFICITLGAHVKYWRLMKSDKAILLVCLCVTFLVCYALFLAGVTKTSNESVCTGIAVVLHYVFLVLFFLMLAEGVSVFITVTFPFHKKSHITELLIIAFLLPLVITGVSAGVTKLDGYGNEHSCWLTPGTGIFWSFAGPAAVVILANFISIGLFFRRLYGTKATASKSVKEKAQMTAIAVGVLTPVMGLTWIFGIFSVNKETLWLQYVFCIFNIFQGVFIFAFHCYGNKQLRRVIKASRERKKSMKEFTSELKDKIKHRFDTHHTDTTETSASAINNDKSTIERELADQFSTTDADIKSVSGNVEPWDRNTKDDEWPSNPAGYINPVYHGESLQLEQNNTSLTSEQNGKVSNEDDTTVNRSVKTDEKADDKVINNSDRLCEIAADISVDSTECSEKKRGDIAVNSSDTMEEKAVGSVINGSDKIVDNRTYHTDETAGDIAVNSTNYPTKKTGDIVFDSSNNINDKAGDITVFSKDHTTEKPGNIAIDGPSYTDKKLSDIDVNNLDHTDEKAGDITDNGLNNTDEKSGDMDVNNLGHTVEKVGDITVNGSNTDEKAYDNAVTCTDKPVDKNHVETQ